MVKIFFKATLLSIFIFHIQILFAAQTDCPVQLALTDTQGSPITTTVNYEVHFYSALTGGSEIATAETDSLIPSGGVLVIPITCDTTLLSHPNIFLEFIINGETLTPRVEMASTPFAGTAFAVAGNSINLGTDTVGSYVASAVAGSGISITGGTGEGAALTISATGLTLSAGDVTSTIILDGTIAAVDLADGSVTSAKILDGTIAAADLASDSVTSAKIVDGTITNTDIVAAAGIPYSKLTFADNIVAGDIATNAVTTTEILDATITSTDVAADAFDFTSLTDSMTLDASTDISVTGTNVFSITNTGTGNSFVVNDQAGDTSPFVIDATGKVGILNPTPAAELDVAGSAAITNTGVGNSLIVNDQTADGSPFVINQDGDATFGRMVSYPIQEVTTAGPLTLTPSAPYIFVECTAGPCAITLSEAGASSGQVITIINVSDDPAETLDFSNSAGIQHMNGGVLYSLSAAGLAGSTSGDTVTFIYRASAWYEIQRDNP